MPLEFSEGKFQENKDWNSIRLSMMPTLSASEGKFQENKDWNPAQEMSWQGKPASEGKFQENKDWNTLALKVLLESVDPLRASSKKTRIETRRVQMIPMHSIASEGKFQENKDWNIIECLMM